MRFGSDDDVLLLGDVHPGRDVQVGLQGPVDPPVGPAEHLERLHHLARHAARELGAVHDVRGDGELEGIYQQLPNDKNFYLLFNKFVTGSSAEPLSDLPVVHTVPCHCDHVIAADEEIFAATRLDHPFTQDIRKIVDKMQNDFKF